jgi:outer membrane protein assembly factor BamD (BamD/ComL family)
MTENIGIALLIATVCTAILLVAFFVIGLPLIRKLGEKASKLCWPDDSQFKLLPEYSVAEARVKQGRFAEAVVEYRKVIAQFPEDVYPHLRIAELALEKLNDTGLAEAELLTAKAKAAGEDTMALTADRLADFYQHVRQDHRRAVEALESVRQKLPDSKHAARAGERIETLKAFMAGHKLEPPPAKVGVRPSRYRMQ